MTKTVLVTGGTGSIASWTIVELLRLGYNVRTTIRHRDSEASVKQRVSIAAEVEKLSFYTADLLHDAGWEKAIQGCDYVLHLAAPVGVRARRNPDDLIIPTRDGALRVLRTACDAKVKRVILTSAIEACRPPMVSPNCIADETYWTQTDDKHIGPYRLAKTLAEKAAWDFMESHSNFTKLTTILPSAVTGPTVSADCAHTTTLVQRMLNGSLPRYPDLGFCVVDVRDVADLHIRAMTLPQAENERFIAASDWIWMEEVASILKSNFGSMASKVPTKKMPNWFLRMVALFNSEMKFAAPLLGRKHVFASQKAQSVLGWKPRSAFQSIIDSARSAIDLNII